MKTKGDKMDLASILTRNLDGNSVWVIAAMEPLIVAIDALSVNGITNSGEFGVAVLESVRDISNTSLSNGCAAEGVEAIRTVTNIVDMFLGWSMIGGQMKVEEILDEGELSENKNE